MMNKEELHEVFFIVKITCHGKLFVPNNDEKCVCLK